MTETEFLTLLNEIDFPDRYWSLCDRFPANPLISSRSGKKKDILSAFSEVGVLPECHSADGAYICEREEINGTEWLGTFCKQRSGLELFVEGASSEICLGSNFADLAYRAKQLADTSFQRDRFKGPPPYPRPDHNGNPHELKEIIKEFVVLLRSIKSAIRSRRLISGSTVK